MSTPKFDFKNDDENQAEEAEKGSTDELFDSDDDDKNNPLKPRLELISEYPVFVEGETTDSALVLAALTTDWRNELPVDNVEAEILRQANMLGVNQYEQTNIDRTIGYGCVVEATVHKNGDPSSEFKIARGPISAILTLCSNGNREAIADEVEAFLSKQGKEIKCIGVSKTNENGEWLVVAIVPFDTDW
jgi:hypothetical protein